MAELTVRTMTDAEFATYREHSAEAYAAQQMRKDLRAGRTA